MLEHRLHGSNEKCLTSIRMVGPNHVSFFTSEIVLSKRITYFPWLIIAIFFNNVPIAMPVLHQTPDISVCLIYFGEKCSVSTRVRFCHIILLPMHLVCARSVCYAKKKQQHLRIEFCRLYYPRFEDLSSFHR